MWLRDQESLGPAKVGSVTHGDDPAASHKGPAAKGLNLVGGRMAASEDSRGLLPVAPAAKQATAPSSGACLGSCAAHATPATKAEQAAAPSSGAHSSGVHASGCGGGCGSCG